MIFNELLALYESATPRQRQRVLDAIPGNPVTEDQAIWEKAMRTVFCGDESRKPLPGSECCLYHRTGGPAFIECGVDAYEPEQSNPDEPDGIMRDGIARVVFNRGEPK